MKNLNLCPQCGNQLPEDTSICEECGYEVQTKIVKRSNKAMPAEKKIETVEDMENYLQSLSSRANESVGAALAAQMQVVRFVQSPKLVDSSFDLLFKNIKNAINYAETPMMQEQIRERSTLMIQNYIFFIEAKLQFEEDKSVEESRQMMVSAVKMLADSVTNIAQMAVTGYLAVGFKNAFVQSMTDNLPSKDNSGESFMGQLINMWANSTRIARQREKMLESIDAITAKFYKYRDVIGKSDLIAGIVSRYSNDMVEYFNGSAVMMAEEKLSQCKGNMEFSIKFGILAIVVLNIVILIIRWIVKGVGHGIDRVSSAISDTEYVPDTSHWALTQWGIAAVVVAFWVIIKYMQHKKKIDEAKAVLAEMQTEYKNRQNYYNEIVRAFEETV